MSDVFLHLFVGFGVGLLLARQHSLSGVSTTQSTSGSKAIGDTVVAQLRKQNERLRVANKRLGQHHQRLQSHRPTLFLPPLPLNAHYAITTPEHQQKKERYHKFNRNLTEREANFNAKRSNHKDWLDLPTSFPYKDAASAETKHDINHAIAEELIEMKTSQRLKSNSKNILLILDAPTFGTTRTILKSYPSLEETLHQIVIPQADVSHYFQMIRGDQGQPYANIRCQRLDHWLCANANFGFQCICVYLDYECTFQGNGNSKVSPMLDIQRFFRLKYPANGEGYSLLVLTIKLRGEMNRIEFIDCFIEVEAELNGYHAERQKDRTFAKSLTTLFYKIT
jgi:hypothetical protein